MMGSPDSKHATRRATQVGSAVAIAFVLQLDNAIVNLALPTLHVDLGLDLADLEWVISGYMITFASLLLVGGRVVDRVGLRRAVAAGLALFIIASLAAALAPNGPMLVSARVVQGIGAALLAPTTFTVVSTAFNDDRRRRLAVGAWGAATSLALVAGPPLGGLLTAAGSWRLIFLINVPIGAVVFATVMWSYVGTDRGSRTVRVEAVPGLLTTAAVAGAAFTLIEGPRQGWSSPMVLVVLLLAVTAAVIFLRGVRTSTSSLVNLGLLRDRVFGVGTAALAAWSLAMFGIASYTSIYLQNVIGLGPAAAGLVFLPFAAAMAVSSSGSGALAGRLGVRTTVLVGFALNAAALCYMGSFGAEEAALDLAVPLFLLGVGAGLTMPLHAEIGARLPQEDSGSASALLSLVRETSSLMGVAVLGAVVAIGSGGSQGGPGYLAGYQTAAVVAAAVVAAGGLLAALSLRGGPVHLSTADATGSAD